MKDDLDEAIEALKFVRDAGTKSVLPPELILESVRREAATTLRNIGIRHETHLQRVRAVNQRERARATALERKLARRYRHVYTPETAPTPLHELLVELATPGRDA